MLCIFLIPQFVFVFLQQSSLAPGMMVAITAIYIYGLRCMKKLTFSSGKILLFSIAVFILLAQSGYIAAFYDNYKPLFTLPALIIIFLGATLFSNRLLTVPPATLASVFRAVTYTLLLLGWISVIHRIDIGSYVAKPKAVFPFSEESHYALTVGIFVCASGILMKNRERVVLLANLLLQALIFPSLTLLVFCMMAVFIFWMARRITLMLTIIVVLVASVYFMLTYFSDLPAIAYFGSRLTISDDTDNLTTLVFLQGLDDAKNALLESHGLGLGLQMAGTNGVGQYGYVIQSLAGSDFNRNDGGFLASKIVSEFGAVGLLLSVGYLFILKKAVNTINRIRDNTDMESTLLKIAMAVVIAYAVEFFLRGYGYFSPGLFLFVTMMMVGNTLHRQRTRAVNPLSSPSSLQPQS
ncbi:hypothetical protein CTB91_01350 [Dickeya solani]|uniref:Intermembrane protein n=1 Tax=Dickeya solani D s0432-1 TaxID=1231725 RepID=A0AAV3KBN3_9GAMM|nr:hypothetical protein A4U42_15740 [Dickeya solani IPO 2222]AUC44312.1 hypothetical protein D083_3963 [Dickeya solani RNS 08.23.3.1.A]AUH07928.1 hypothetical protein BJD21_05300 [Dickeya solani D s0432-1]AUH11950.1 hypothetical protein BJJ98_05265 [Dickeya solani]AYQ47166.1 hypothetical protein CTB91_01350 [Dickeya solani]